MNILIDAHVFDDKHQGTRTYLKGLYSELIPLAKDWNFFMVANDIANLKDEFGEHANVTYIPLKSHNKFYRLLVELPAIIRKYNIDYSHYQYVGTPIKAGKQIITTHDILFEQKEFKSYFPFKYRLTNSFLFKRSAKHADVLLTVSKYSRHKISELYDIPLETIHVTPNAVHANFKRHSFQEASNGILDLGKYILYVARIEPRKNHLALLKAFTELQLAQKGYKLVFIGRKDIPNPELEAYNAKSKPINGDAVVWLDSIPNDELASYYQHCELFVFPSFAEGFGIPPLEAMATGCKLLCSKNTAMADFNLPESLTFDPYNVGELKLKMQQQLNTDEVLVDMYNKILEKYNWNRVAADFFGLIHEHYKNS
ncbi:MAG: glycosyltransferase family 1 protein [Gelidibacter sp.]